MTETATGIETATVMVTATAMVTARETTTAQLGELCTTADCNSSQFIALKDAGVTKPAAQVNVDEGSLW